MQRMLFKGINASDLLGDILLRFRPYAEDKDQVRALLAERLEALEAVVQNGAETAELVQWGEDTVTRFKSLPLKNHERFPLVLYIGEIYMRQHDPYTSNVIEQLEQQGLEAVRDPVTDWLDYVNKVSIRNSKRDLKLRIKAFDLDRAFKDTKKYVNSIIKSKYMTSIEQKLAEPFHEVLEGRHVLPKPMDMIDMLEANHEFHGNIEGESPLSAGIAYNFMHDLIRPRGEAYISGIFHVGPFTCMQEGVATAKIEAMAQELRKKKPDLVFPIIHAFFGDSASANIDSEIAVFVEQCYQKRDMLREKYGQRFSPSGAVRKIEIKSVTSSKRKAESLSGIKET
jgi:predicted nucleotide-binding protein (sugar kinase/HSP70/actin superfamily)